MRPANPQKIANNPPKNPKARFKSIFDLIISSSQATFRHCRHHAPSLQLTCKESSDWTRVQDTYFPGAKWELPCLQPGLKLRDPT